MKKRGETGLHQTRECSGSHMGEPRAIVAQASPFVVPQTHFIYNDHHVAFSSSNLLFNLCRAKRQMEFLVSRDNVFNILTHLPYDWRFSISFFHGLDVAYIFALS